MAAAQEILDQVSEIIGAAGRPAIWQDRRVYLNLVASQRSFHGDRTRQLYIDLATGKLVNQMGKGFESSGFIAAHKAVAAKLLAAGF